jgi:hypothetical protein
MESSKKEGKLKQRKLEPWSWLKMEARKILIEIAREIEGTTRMLEEDED